MDENFIKRMASIAEAAGEGLVTQKEVAETIAHVVNFFKDLFNTHTERLDAVEEAYKKGDETLGKRIDTVENDLITTEKSLITRIEHIQLTPGEPGKDADPEKVMRMVLAEIELPEPKDVEPLKAEVVRDLLETLPEGKRFDAKFIDGLKDLIKGLIPEQKVRIFGGRVGMHMYIDGAKIGVVNTLNLLAGDGIQFDYLNKNGFLTLTITNADSGGGQWYLGEHITLAPDKKTFDLDHAPGSKVELMLDRQPQVYGLDFTGTIDGVNTTFAFIDAVDDSLLTNVYANYQ